MIAANVVDSSGRLEDFTDSDRAPLFAPAIEDAENLFVPVISIYEVLLEAARHPLPLADGIIYATAMRHEATLWTQDEHFQDLPNVRYFPRQPTA